MKTAVLGQRRAISPIIATLLLILIAIAAGVVVYAYVVGFIGNSTSNTGATTNTLSIDQLTLTHASNTAPVTVYVRNLGPSSEAFNSGFYVKGSSLNDQLGIALTVATSGVSGITEITRVTIQEVSGTPTEFTATIYFTGTCTAGTISVTAFGKTATTATCSSQASPFTTGVSPAISTFTLSDSPQFVADTGTMLTGFVPPTSGTLLGAPVTAGTVNLGINLVGQFSLALAPGATGTTNPLTAGSTYSVQVTGTDGGSTTASAKSS